MSKGIKVVQNTRPYVSRESFTSGDGTNPFPKKVNQKTNSTVGKTLIPAVNNEYEMLGN